MDTKSLAAFIVANVAYIAATLRNVARKYGMAFADAEVEDMIQEVQIRALSTPAINVDNEYRAKGYVASIASNLAIDIVRARKATVAIGEESTDDDGEVTASVDLVSGTPDAERILAAKEHLAEVMATAADVLSAPDHDLFLAMMRDGGPDMFDADAYAQQTSTTNLAIRVRKSRVLVTIREYANA